MEDSDKSFREMACVLCGDGNDGEEELVKVRAKGLATLCNSSVLRCDERLSCYLQEQQAKGDAARVLVHKHCRRDYTNAKRIKSETGAGGSGTDAGQIRRRSSSHAGFDWKSCCLFCGLPAVVDERHPDRGKVHEVTTLQFKQSILTRCSNRSDDQAETVARRVHSCIDLVAVEAKYHGNCKSLFLLKTSSKGHSAAQSKTGRREDEEMKDSFEKLTSWLDNETELFTVTELHAKMSELSNGAEIYSKKWLNTKLKEHYGESIYFTDHAGRSSVVSFKDMTSSILSDKWYRDRKEDVVEESKRVLTAAANLLKNETRCFQHVDTGSYPSKSDIVDVLGCLPPSLAYFMQLLIPSEIKQGSIAQCILKALRPNSVLPPLLFGLAVECDHVVGSRWLTDELSKLGFALSYSEVQRYKQSVLVDRDAAKAHCEQSEFTQFVADNVDHNIVTLDGKGTFHGMGIISCSIKTDAAQDHKVKRIAKMMTKEDIPKENNVKICWYDKPDITALSKKTFTSINQLKCQLTDFHQLNIDILWHSASVLKRNNIEHPRPNWSGFMHLVTHGTDSPHASAITMLPIIDLNPGDLSCIYSTLLFVQKQSKQINMITPCITFDQPLWIKAVEIASAKSLDIVVRLGGFHCLMSFVGSIGSLMEGSGIENLLETIYGRNTAPRMISGKAISRALRGHFLVDAGLHMKLLQVLLPDSTSNLPDILGLPRLLEEDVEEIDRLYSSILDGDIWLTDVEESATLNKVQEHLGHLKTVLAAKSRTAKLWILYMDYVQIVKSFIRAERSGSWTEHLAATMNMLNLFAATGHIHYAKSARLYLQMMLKLEEEFRLWPMDSTLCADLTNFGQVCGLIWL